MKLSKSKLIESIVICELAGVVGSFFTTPEIAKWYALLAKPSLNPPAWIFAPVWSILYLLMGISLCLVWSDYKKQNEERKKSFGKIALSLFFLQLLLNVLWSSIFFGQHALGMSFLELCCLWLAILLTAILFARISKAAAWLLVPYILWVTFAGALNYSIWQLNNVPANNSGTGLACTMEAKMCPDGSYVGRTGSNCEFAACPTSNSKQKIQYPI